jgi:hypothetical protein
MVLPVLMHLSYTPVGGTLTNRYLVNNTENLTYPAVGEGGSQEYTGFAFRFDPPDEKMTGFGNSSLTIDAVDQSIISELRSVAAAPTITMKAMFYYDEDAVLVFEPLASYDFTMRNLTYNVDSISCTLEYEDRWQNQMGPIEFTPWVTPGVF